MSALGSNAYSICKDCAVANGAKPVDGHMATWWSAHCDVCREYRGLCDVSDWNWPEGKKPKTFSLMRRD